MFVVVDLLTYFLLVNVQITWDWSRKSYNYKDKKLEKKEARWEKTKEVVVAEVAVAQLAEIVVAVAVAEAAAVVATLP